MIAKYTVVDGKTIRLMSEPIFSVCIAIADVVVFRCMADVIAIVLVHDIDRICKYSGMADVICLVADVKTTLSLLV